MLGRNMRELSSTEPLLGRNGWMPGPEPPTALASKPAACMLAFYIFFARLALNDLALHLGATLLLALVQACTTAAAPLATAAVAKAIMSVGKDAVQHWPLAHLRERQGHLGCCSPS